MLPSGSFLACDVTEVEKLSYIGNVWDQDVYVLNFLLSEIFLDSPRLRAFMTEVVKFAKPGARFVFIERGRCGCDG
jgi:hypothetical protein